MPNIISIGQFPLIMLETTSIDLITCSTEHPFPYRRSNTIVRSIIHLFHQKASLACPNGRESLTPLLLISSHDPHATRSRWRHDGEGRAVVGGLPLHLLFVIRSTWDGLPPCRLDTDSVGELFGFVVLCLVEFCLIREEVCFGLSTTGEFFYGLVRIISRKRKSKCCC